MKKQKVRQKHTHLDWITLYGQGEGQRGAELLKTLRDKIGAKSNENTFSGYGGGWYFEQFTDRGIRLSSTDEGALKVELQGLFWSGAIADPFIEFLRISKEVQTIKDKSWNLTRVDVAIDLYGVPLDLVFPSPTNKRYKWNFPFTYSQHQTKGKTKDLKFTGFTIRKQRWSLTVYDKQEELKNGNPHPIKKNYFKTLEKNEKEPISRIELRIKSREALAHVQSFLEAPSDELELCGTILTHWAKYHPIKTTKGNDEARFKNIFKTIDPVVFEKKRKEKLGKLFDEHIEVKIRDKARDFIRYGLEENKSLLEVIQIFEDQIQFLKSNDLSLVNIQPRSQKPEDDPQGSP